MSTKQWALSGGAGQASAYSFSASFLQVTEHGSLHLPFMNQQVGMNFQEKIEFEEYIRKNRKVGASTLTVAGASRE